MLIHRARTLRSNATRDERALWQILRLLKPYGLHFRRQVPIGRFIADFACHSAKLVVELDGSQHAESRQRDYDIKRTDFLRSRGYTVLCFWNHEVATNRDGVVEAILAATPTRSAFALRALADRPPRKREV